MPAVLVLSVAELTGVHSTNPTLLKARAVLQLMQPLVPISPQKILRENKPQAEPVLLEVLGRNDKAKQSAVPRERRRRAHWQLVPCRIHVLLRWRHLDRNWKVCSRECLVLGSLTLKHFSMMGVLVRPRDLPKRTQSLVPVWKD